jgi:putative DNA primase/helicase
LEVRAMKPQVAAKIAAMVDGSRAEAMAAAGLFSPQGQDDSDDGDVDIWPSDLDCEQVDLTAVKECANRDHSDTDNGKRIRRHFGNDLLALEVAESKTPTFAVWRPPSWDLEYGAQLAHRIAQKLGDLIWLEADYLTLTPIEERLCTAAAQASRVLANLEGRKDKWTAADKARANALKGTIAADECAKEALKKRRQARRKFAVTSKNRGRIDAALHCAGAHIAVSPDAFNPDPYVFATLGHTIRFIRDRDDECPDPDICRWRARVEVIEGHRREDMLTRYVPHDYDAAAKSPNWEAFLGEFLPEAAVREFVQTFSGIGLLGRTVQKIVFHYGRGANGKSVFLETLMRVLGTLAVGLPAESITGHNERNAGAASPDLARLYGARSVRILELPANKPLHEDLIKKLTGGEKIPVRSLFKGYFEFAPVFTCHMSGNGYPRIDGTDNGIWRRMAVVHWPVTIPVEKRREFEDVLASFAPEYSGILNWLIKGAMRFIEAGLPEPPAVVAATQEYRDEMDPVGQFMRDCVERDVRSNITRAEAFAAYEAWAFNEGHNPLSRARFRTAFVAHGVAEKTIHGERLYANCCLHDVPDRPVTLNGFNPG